VRAREPGSAATKRPTQQDVARRAGVSRATVSYVLNGLANGRVPISDETRERVMLAIAELGYVPDASAQALRSGSTHTLGLIIPDIEQTRTSGKRPMALSRARAPAAITCCSPAWTSTRRWARRVP